VSSPQADLAAARAVLARGGVVVYPTETFYGLGARALVAAAVARVASLKGREATKPIAVIVSDAAMVGHLARRVPELAERLMARFWPGPLTLVLPARAGLPAQLTAGSGLVGVRVSSHPVARALVAALGEPITATSANRGGEPPACDVATAERALGAGVDVYLDGGAVPGGAASTVVVVGDDAVRVIRAGAVSLATLRDALGATPLESSD
jgi:L-threonylcarbamoyladenylate synthase